MTFHNSLLTQVPFTCLRTPQKKKEFKNILKRISETCLTLDACFICLSWHQALSKNQDWRRARVKTLPCKGKAQEWEGVFKLYRWWLAGLSHHATPFYQQFLVFIWDSLCRSGWASDGVISILLNWIWGSGSFWNSQNNGVVVNIQQLVLGRGSLIYSISLFLEWKSFYYIHHDSAPHMQIHIEDVTSLKIIHNRNLTRKRWFKWICYINFFQ